MRRPAPAPGYSSVLVPEQPPAQPLPLAISVVDAAKMVGLGLSSMRKLIAANRVKAVRVGMAIVVPVVELERFLEREAGAHLDPKEVQP